MHINSGVPKVLSTKLDHSNINLFADDTVFMHSFDNKIDGGTKINSDLSNFFKWSQDWLVLFSAPKLSL